MRVLWLRAALKDLRALRSYISKDNPKAANRVAASVLEAITRIQEHPHMGKPGRVFETRELFISRTPYLVVYRVQHNMIHVMRVLHVAMRWPEDPSP